MPAHTTEIMHKQMESIGYEYVADGWYCVDGELLRKKHVRRIGDRRHLKMLHQKISVHIDGPLKAELIERRVPGQKFVMFHICERKAFEDRWFADGKYYKQDICDLPFGVFQAIPHFYDINYGDIGIRYTEECSRCKAQLSTNIIGSMKLKYTLE